MAVLDIGPTWTQVASTGFTRVALQHPTYPFEVFNNDTPPASTDRGERIDMHNRVFVTAESNANPVYARALKDYARISVSPDVGVSSGGGGGSSARPDLLRVFEVNPAPGTYTEADFLLLLPTPMDIVADPTARLTIKVQEVRIDNIVGGPITIQRTGANAEDVTLPSYIDNGDMVGTEIEVPTITIPAASSCRIQIDYRDYR